jgi:protease inhibitor Inh
MKHIRFAALFFLACAGLASAQPSQPVADAARERVGAWEISNADHDRRCAINLSVDPAPGGLKLELDPGCASVFPPLKEVAAWTIVPNGPLRLIDGRGATVLALSEVESGIFEGERRGEGLYFMQPQAALTIPVRTAEQVFGDWNFQREADNPLCTVTLSNTPEPGAGYKLAMKQGCDASIADFGLSSWQLEGDQLVLTGRSGAWRFVESDTNIWERIPPSTDPLLLMK